MTTGNFSNMVLSFNNFSLTDKHDIYHVLFSCSTNVRPTAGRNWQGRDFAWLSLSSVLHPRCNSAHKIEDSVCSTVNFLSYRRQVGQGSKEDVAEKDFLVELNQREEEHTRKRAREKEGKGADIFIRVGLTFPH
jgi:hypothetical protein